MSIQRVVLKCLLMLVKKRLESDLHAKADAVEKLHNDGAKMFAAVEEMKIQKVAVASWLTTMQERE